jgi:hypothetical protein
VKQALAIPSAVFCRGDSICSVCPTTGFLDCRFSQPVSNKIAKNVILNIVGIVIRVFLCGLPFFEGCNMHLVGFEDFQRNAIYRLDLLEMRLRRSDVQHPRLRGHQANLAAPAGANFTSRTMIGMGKVDQLD